MSNYKSKHTGAQVDEAVSKVLNGEVGGGADWGAQEGEAGFIANKPFNTIVQQTYNIQKESVEFINGYYNIELFPDYHISDLPLDEFDYPCEWWVVIKEKVTTKYIDVMVPLYLFNNRKLA